MLETLKSCQICGSSDFAILNKLIDQDDPYKKTLHLSDDSKWMVCVRCSFIFQNPRPPKLNIEKWYTESEYRKVHPEVIEEGYIRTSPLQMLRFGQWLQTCGLDPMRIRDAVCLDYGCGIGGALDFLAGQGCQIHGVELDQRLADYGNSHYRIKVVPTLDKLPQGQKYHFMFTHHTLEHVYDPNEFLHYAATHLHENGALVVVVPAWRFSNSEETFQEFCSAHNCMFDHVSLAALLNNHGFHMSAYMYQNSGDWEICAIAQLSRRRNYFPFHLDEIFDELYSNIRRRINERRIDSSGLPDRIASR